MSAIAAMSTEGINCSQGANIGGGFYNFVEMILLPHLQPFDGSSSHSVVIMDNCSIHYTKEVVSLIEEIGVIVHFQTCCSYLYRQDNSMAMIWWLYYFITLCILLVITNP